MLWSLFNQEAPEKKNSSKIHILSTKPNQANLSYHKK